MYPAGTCKTLTSEVSLCCCPQCMCVISVCGCVPMSLQLALHPLHTSCRHMACHNIMHI